MIVSKNEVKMIFCVWLLKCDKKMAPFMLCPIYMILFHTFCMINWSSQIATAVAGVVASLALIFAVSQYSIIFGSL